MRRRAALGGRGRTCALHDLWPRLLSGLPPATMPKMRREDGAVLGFPHAMNRARRRLSGGARYQPCSLTLAVGKIGLRDLPEQRARHFAVDYGPRRTAWNRSYVRTWPDEGIAFGGDDPGWQVVQAEPALFGHRKGNGIRRIGRGRMSDGQDQDLSVPLADLHRERQHQGGPVLPPFFPPGGILIGPEVGVADDTARRRWRAGGHAPSCANLSISGRN
ncbi:protein of unknown function (plasmid) [Rhodovastum atsumiense]|nr:protein of unknown function [Rhodovastum atsumiense]